MADSLAQLGVGEGDGVAILVRNHRGFLDASLAAAKLGADMLYLNTAFAAPQLGEVCEREKPSVVIHDQEFTELIDKAGVEQQRILAWVDDDAGDLDTLEGLIEKGEPKPRKRPGQGGAGGDSHLGHDRHAKGGSPWRRQPERRGRAALPDAAEVRLEDPHRRSALPHLGLGAPEHGDAAGQHQRAHPHVRPRDKPRRPCRTTTASRSW